MVQVFYAPLSVPTSPDFLLIYTRVTGISPLTSVELLLFYIREGNWPHCSPTPQVTPESHQGLGGEPGSKAIGPGRQPGQTSTTQACGFAQFSLFAAVPGSQPHMLGSAGLVNKRRARGKACPCVCHGEGALS